MLKYLHLLGVFYKSAILADLEYRANFLVGMVLSLVASSWVVIGVGIFYLHTDQIGDWSFAEMMVVVGLFVTFLGFIDMILYPNVQEIVKHIRTGTMDFILTKPVNSQFHASLRKINIWKFADMVMGVALTVYGMSQLNQLPSAGQVILFVLLCINAIIILYALIMLLITSSFWFVQLENVMELLFVFYDAGRFPVTIFPSWLRILLTFVVPIAFVTTVPASMLVGRVDMPAAIASFGVAAGLLTISIAFWRYAVRHYSSASS